MSCGGARLTEYFPTTFDNHTETVALLCEMFYISLTHPYNWTSYRTLHNCIETIFLRHVFEDGVSYDSLLEIVYGKCSIQTAWNIFDLYVRFVWLSVPKSIFLYPEHLNASSSDGAAASFEFLGSDGVWLVVCKSLSFIFATCLGLNTSAKRFIFENCNKSSAIRKSMIRILSVTFQTLFVWIDIRLHTFKSISLTFHLEELNWRTI